MKKTNKNEKYITIREDNQPIIMTKEELDRCAGDGKELVFDVADCVGNQPVHTDEFDVDDVNDGGDIISCGGIEKPEPLPKIKEEKSGSTPKKSVISEKNGNGITEIVFIIDKSGSMSGLEDDTIGGINSFIEKQKSENGVALVTTVLFSTSFEKKHDRIEISKIEPLTRDDYRVGGGTALYDALGDTIEHITTVHRYIRKEDVPEKTIFVITTDGEENSSQRYGSADVKKKIKVCEKTLGWEFLFLGADIDAFAAADRIGINRSRTAKYDRGETDTMFRTVSSAVSYCRRVGSIDEKWAKDIDTGDNDD